VTWSPVIIPVRIDIVPSASTTRRRAGSPSNARSFLPVPYFLVTLTLPAALRPVARAPQPLLYNLLFQTSSAALRALALDPKYVGGQIGMIGVRRQGVHNPTSAT
jgi:hypothetical protein